MPVPSHADARRLPVPTAAEQTRSERLRGRIRAEIEAAGGAIDFARYMELSLYAPGLGYYASGAARFGEGGDFVTAPELSPLLAQCLARQYTEILDRLGGGDLLEAGAGSGRLAAELLSALERLGTLPGRYLILELSPALRRRQAETLRRVAPHLAGRVQWCEALPDNGFRGVVFANELLDALPVARFWVRGREIVRLGVGWKDGGFVWREQPADEATVARIAPLDLLDGYTSEIGFHAEAWVRTLAERLEAGVMLLIDYGFPQRELYHPERRAGTLMCHYRHRAHDDPLILTGLQDITAHVDFTAIAEAGAEAGLELNGYTSQAAFLLALGIHELDAEAADARARLEHAQQVKKLTLPHEMGELFKVIALGRGVPGRLSGFSLLDRSGRL